MDRDDLLTLLDGMDWSRERMFTALAPLTAAELRRPLGGSFGDLHSTLAHIYGAEAIWTTRLRALTTTAAAAPVPFPSPEATPDLPALRDRWRASSADLRAWVESQPPTAPQMVIHYKNTQGAEFRTPLGAILTHLAQHQAYHRGQVTHMLRQLGKPALQTDFIAFWRARYPAAPAS